MNQISLENFKIDKSNWKKVKLGDVVSEPKETVKDPVAEGIQHVVGLEHIDSEDIHLRRSANIDELTTFTKKFNQGDVLFGRRRAYLKKAAFAEFDGICSGDITVMRTKNALLPELLPFIINNDKFFDYAITHSAGGLSPRVKFKDLSNFELLLPPKNQQVQIAELFWAINDVIQHECIVRDKLESSLISERRSRLNEISGSDVILDEIIFPISKIKVGKLDKDHYQLTGKCPIVDQSQAFISGYTDDESLVYKGDLPVIVFGDHTTILKFIDFPFVMGADGTKVIKPKININVKYLYHVLVDLNLATEGYKRHFSILKSKSIKKYTDSDQCDEMVKALDRISRTISDVDQDIYNAIQVKKILINTIF